MIDLTRHVSRLERKVRRQSTLGGAQFPRRAVMWHDQALATVGNAIAVTAETTQRFNFYADQSAAADGDTFTNGCFLAAGTYSFSVLGRTSTDRGKIDWTIDGESIVAGEDWYASPAAANVVKTTTSVSVTFSGWHVVTGTINGKNGSSSDYKMRLTSYWFTPSAD